MMFEVCYSICSTQRLVFLIFSSVGDGFFGDTAVNIGTLK